MARPGINHKARGFTLIEMLVTLTIFGALMAVLVVGLRTGIQTWERVRTHQNRTAAEQAAIAIFRSDMEHIAIVSDTLHPVVETKGDNDSEILTLSTLPSRSELEHGLLSSWSQIEYKIGPTQTGELSVLIREARPHASLDNPIVGVAGIRTILEGVDAITFDYTSKNEETDTWSAENPPSVIRVSIQRSGRPDLTTQFNVPTTALQP